MKEQIGVHIGMALAGNGEAFTEALVKETLNQKVDSSGRVSNYSNDNKFTFISVVCQKLIKEAVQEAMQGWIKDNGDMIKRKVMQHLEAHPDKVVKNIVDGVGNAFDQQFHYGFSVRLDYKD